MIDYQKIIGILREADLLEEYRHLGRTIKYTGLVTDSRQAEPGSVFICIRGYESDGHDWARTAVQKGSLLLIVERHLPLNTDQIRVTDSRQAAAVLAREFFGNPTSGFVMIGITGTNGKTTIAHLLEQLLSSYGKRVGMIGTIGYRIAGEYFPCSLTTPDILELNRIFYQMRTAGVEYLVMEVSSHALYLDRVYGQTFDYAIFTNLSRDHLDFHSSLEEYAGTKFKIFSQLRQNSGKAVLNIDDLWGSRFHQKLSCPRISISAGRGDYQFQMLESTTEGSSFNLVFRDNSYTFQTRLTGLFNLFNITAALAVFTDLFPLYPINRLMADVQSLMPVRGRMEKIANDRGLHIFIDYAHSPAALETVLDTLGQFCTGRLICVFGAGGNRDRGKRPDMLQTVLARASLAIITNDNPRREDPSAIIYDMLGPEKPEKPFWVIRNRALAIRSAIHLARPDDIVLIAGKGHETYQIIGEKRDHFDDREEVLQALAEAVRTDIPVIPVDILQVQITAGKVVKPLQEQILQALSTDSRTIADRSLFFALTGLHHDGHAFVDEILNRRDNWAVVKSGFKSAKENIIRVPDPLKLYGELAAGYRKLFAITAIAITGSVGKTTTKEYLFNILSQRHRVLKTQANENNLIGLPKTLYQLRPEHEFAVLEMGTNQPGEIARLADIASPDIALITSIGASHLEFLDNEDGVFLEKKVLFDRPLQLRIFPAGDVRFKSYEGKSFGDIMESDYFYHEVRSTDAATSFRVNNEKFEIPTGYRVYVSNAAAAIAVACELGMPADLIREGLLQPLACELRMELRNSGERLLMLDCYNANPQSMQAALTYWQQRNPERPHVAILGDMLELGSRSAELHREIGMRLEDLKDGELISVGEQAVNYGAGRHFTDVLTLLDSAVLDKLPTNAVVLVKASHGIHLEKIIGRL